MAEWDGNNGAPAMRIGYLGIGNRCLPMASKRRDAGHELLIHDVHDEAMRPLLERHARRAASPQALAAGPAAGPRRANMRSGYLSRVFLWLSRCAPHADCGARCRANDRRRAADAKRTHCGVLSSRYMTITVYK